VVSKTVKKWCGWGCFAILFFLLAACGDVRCSGAGETGSCLRIESIAPRDVKDKNTSDVDAFQVFCDAASTSTNPEREVYGAHAAEITVSNRRVQTDKFSKEDISDITLNDFNITYTNNACPLADCPKLVPNPLIVVPNPPIPSTGVYSLLPGNTRVVPVDGSVTFTLPFVSLATKDQYTFFGGALYDAFGVLQGSPLIGAAPASYTATYTIRGTDAYSNPVTVTGSSVFAIGNFNACN